MVVREVAGIQDLDARVVLSVEGSYSGWAPRCVSGLRRTKPQARWYICIRRRYVMNTAFVLISPLKLSCLKT